VGRFGSKGQRCLPALKGRASALALIEHIIFKNKKYTLAIQQELRTGDENLSDTQVGREMRRLWTDEVNDLY
jgi:hypothetical protein